MKDLAGLCTKFLTLLKIAIKQETSGQHMRVGSIRKNQKVKKACNGIYPLNNGNDIKIFPQV